MTPKHIMPAPADLPASRGKPEHRQQSEHVDQGGRVRKSGPRGLQGAAEHRQPAVLVRLVGSHLPGAKEHAQAYQCDHRTAGEHYRGLVADDEILYQRKGEQAYRREHGVGEGRTGAREDSGETAPAEGLLYHQYQHGARRHGRADSYEKGSEYFYGHIPAKIWILGELAKNMVQLGFFVGENDRSGWQICNLPPFCQPRAELALRQ